MQCVRSHPRGQGLDDPTTEVSPGSWSEPRGVPRLIVESVTNVKRYRMRPRRALEFSGLDQQHGLAACADFMSAAGTLFPIAPCGLCSL